MCPRRMHDCTLVAVQCAAHGPGPKSVWLKCARNIRQIKRENVHVYGFI